MRGNGVFTENIENIFEIEGRNVTDRESLPDLPGYVTAKQAAKMLGLSDRRIYQLIEAGRLPAVKAGEHILLSVEAIEQFKPRLTGRPRARARRELGYRPAVGVDEGIARTAAALSAPIV